MKQLIQKLQNLNKKETWVLLSKCIFLGLLPLLVSIVTCVSQGYSISQVSLANSEWNDELFYYKQVEAILSHGYPQGYFGFNESHALKYSFAAWSPVLVWPWLLHGFLFGWNLLSPIWCNIWLLSLAMVLFVLLVKPTYKQCGLLAVIFCVFTPFARYLLCGMPEIICFSMVIVYWALLYNELEKHKGWKLAGLIFMAVIMTWMRPYLILFLLFPMGIWIVRKKWLAIGGSVVILGITGAVYYAINHYLGAEYFTPLFKTEWLDPFFQGHIFSGIRGILVRIYYEGQNFFRITKQGLISGLAEGAFFNCYLLIMFLLAMQAVVECGKLRREKRRFLHAESEKQQVPAETAEKWRRLRNRILMNGYLAFCFFAMWMALLLMYKMKEGSKHLLTFIVMGLFAVCMMETKFYKKTMAMAALFIFLFWVKGYQPYDYQVPFETEERMAQMEYWDATFSEKLSLSTEQVPNYDNVVIWTFKDGNVLTDWQVLYALPSGFGVSCCYSDYVMEHLDHLQSQYLLIPTGGELQEACEAAGLSMIGDDGRACIYSTRNAYQNMKEALQPEVDAFVNGGYEAFFLSQDDWYTLEPQDFTTYRGLHTYVFQTPLDTWAENKWLLEQLCEADFSAGIGYVEMNPGLLSPEKVVGALQSLLEAKTQLQLSVILAAPQLDAWQSLEADQQEKLLENYSSVLSSLQAMDRVTLYFAAEQEWLIGNTANYVDGENTSVWKTEEAQKDTFGNVETLQNATTWNAEVMHNMLISMICDGKYDVTQVDVKELMGQLRRVIQNGVSNTKYVKAYDSNQADDGLYIMLGDSLFGNYTDSTSIPEVMRSYGGLHTVNCGYGGLCMTVVEDAQSVQDVLDAMLSGDGSKLPAVPAKEGVEKVSSALSQEEQITYLLSYGINDYIGGRELVDEADPMNVNTYAGSLRTAIERLQSNNTSARIVLCTPTGIETFEGGSLDQSGKGYVLKDYRDMVLTIGQEYGLQVIDLYELLPFGREAGVLADGVHPNEKGRYLMALQILEELQ